LASQNGNGGSGHDLRVTHALTEAGSPLKVMALLLCVPPKPVPLTTTVEFTGPEDGDNPVTVGAPSTVSVTPLLVTPKRVTVTVPADARRHLEGEGDIAPGSARFICSGLILLQINRK